MRLPLWALFGGEQLLRPAAGRARAVRRHRRGLGPEYDSRSFNRRRPDPVTSVGVALRANLFGFAIAEIDYVSPLDHRERGWLWQFALRPGF